MAKPTESLHVAGSKLLRATAGKDGRILYAIAFNIFRRGQWFPHDVEYVHAKDAATARNIAIRSFKEKIDIIAVAPAIGFFVEDNHGEVLTTG